MRATRIESLIHVEKGGMFIVPCLLGTGCLERGGGGARGLHQGSQTNE